MCLTCFYYISMVILQFWPLLAQNISPTVVVCVLFLIIKYCNYHCSVFLHYDFVDAVFTQFHKPPVIVYVLLLPSADLTYLLKMAQWEPINGDVHIAMFNHQKVFSTGYGSIPIDTFLVGWTSIYQLFWGSLGTRVLTHPQLIQVAGGAWGPGRPGNRLGGPALEDWSNIQLLRGCSFPARYPLVI